MMEKLLQGSNCLIISWMGLAPLNITNMYVLIYACVRSLVFQCGCFVYDFHPSRKQSCWG
jgi:hypothetical protein